MGNVKYFVGALIAVNLGLVGLLLFRERSVSPAGAQVLPAAVAALPAEPAVTAPAVTAPAPATAPPALVPPVAVVEPVALKTYSPEVAEPTTAPDVAEVPPAVAAPKKRAPKPVPEKARAVSAPSAPAVPAMAPAPALPEVAAEAMPVPAPRSEPRRFATVMVPAGTQIPVRLDVALHSRQVRAGDAFDASLAEDVVVDGKVIAAAGSEVAGRVNEVIEAGKTKGVESLKLTITEVRIGGKSYPVEASVASFRGEQQHDKDAAVIAGSAAVGAILGGIIKGGKGAAVGAVAGAAAGTGAVLATRGKPIVLESGSRLEFTLEQALSITSSRESAPLPRVEPKEAVEPDGGIARR